MALTLEKLLPLINFKIDDTGDFSAFVNDVLQPVLDLLCEEALRWRSQQDPTTMDEQTINALLFDLGNPFEIAETLPIGRRRLLAGVLVDIYKNRGTAESVVDIVRVLTGVEVLNVISPAQFTTWILGVSVLSDDTSLPAPEITDLAILGASPSYARYSFQIEVDQVLTAEQKVITTDIVNLVKPAHTHFLGFIEPGVAPTINHWELGLSFLTENGAPVVGDEIDLHE